VRQVVCSELNAGAAQAWPAASQNIAATNVKRRVSMKGKYQGPPTTESYFNRSEWNAGSFFIKMTATFAPKENPDRN
jgi:hypothetical protein